VGELVPRERWERNVAELTHQYAGFVDARDLTPEEQVIALMSLLPMALRVVDEARDTIERLNAEVDSLRDGESLIEDADLEE
jgi:PII-like signaling protein